MGHFIVGLVARKDFIGNNGRRFKAGESCDEALRWRYPALRACLNEGIIEDTDGCVAKHFGIPDRGQLAEERAMRRESLKLVQNEERPLESDEVDLAPGPDGPREDEIDEEEPDEYEDDVEDVKLSPQHACGVCSKIFDTEKGLQTHKAKVHRE